ncbi:type II toxin-antitoxin system HicB family antitoxin [Crocosphaera sp.]|uniref:type II toxin-antitoxin system HicB family antitoxin n=1 Tax=Crocosphaera sp. TaxID=2729996 RepID=UPI00263A1831|nr:type II toxin-antitoxin system HicB family antitoxin [Crocosphaera sp.]MDJ0581059.1 type II toxin-antitoxin system HicB family antitoxin [Crocosphaera sp.]
MKYKEYKAIIEYDEDDRLFFGRVINIRDIIVFDGLSVDELEQAFQKVIEQYLADCQSFHKAPEIPNSNLFKPRR